MAGTPPDQGQANVSGMVTRSRVGADPRRVLNAQVVSVRDTRLQPDRLPVDDSPEVMAPRGQGSLAEGQPFTGIQGAGISEITGLSVGLAGVSVVAPSVSEADLARSSLVGRSAERTWDPSGASIAGGDRRPPGDGWAGEGANAPDGREPPPAEAPHPPEKPLPPPPERPVAPERCKCTGFYVVHGVEPHGGPPKAKADFHTGDCYIRPTANPVPCWAILFSEGPWLIAAQWRIYALGPDGMPSGLVDLQMVDPPPTLDADWAGGAGVDPISTDKNSMPWDLHGRVRCGRPVIVKILPVQHSQQRLPADDPVRAQRLLKGPPPEEEGSCVIVAELDGVVCGKRYVHINQCGCTAIACYQFTYFQLVPDCLFVSRTDRDGTLIWDVEWLYVAVALDSGLPRPAEWYAQSRYGLFRIHVLVDNGSLVSTPELDFIGGVAECPGTLELLLEPSVFARMVGGADGLEDVLHVVVGPTVCSTVVRFENFGCRCTASLAVEGVEQQGKSAELEACWVSPGGQRDGGENQQPTWQFQALDATLTVRLSGYEDKVLLVSIQADEALLVTQADTPGDTTAEAAVGCPGTTTFNVKVNPGSPEISKWLALLADQDSRSEARERNERIVAQLKVFLDGKLCDTLDVTIRHECDRIASKLAAAQWEQAVTRIEDMPLEVPGDSKPCEIVDIDHMPVNWVSWPAGYAAIITVKWSAQLVDTALFASPDCCYRWITKVTITPSLECFVLGRWLAVPDPDHPDTRPKETLVPFVNDNDARLELKNVWTEWSDRRLTLPGRPTVEDIERASYFNLIPGRPPLAGIPERWNECDAMTTITSFDERHVIRKLAPGAGLPCGSSYAVDHIRRITGGRTEFAVPYSCAIADPDGLISKDEHAYLVGDEAISELGKWLHTAVSSYSKKTPEELERDEEKTPPERAYDLVLDLLTLGYAFVNLFPPGSQDSVAVSYRIADPHIETTSGVAVVTVCFDQPTIVPSCKIHFIQAGQHLVTPDELRNAQKRAADEGSTEVITMQSLAEEHAEQLVKEAAAVAELESPGVTDVWDMTTLINSGSAAEVVFAAEITESGDSLNIVVYKYSVRPPAHVDDRFFRPWGFAQRAMVRTLVPYIDGKPEPWCIWCY